MFDKLVYREAEICSVLGVSFSERAELERMPDPLPYFIIPGHHEHLYPAQAVSEWLTRLCDK